MLRAHDLAEQHDRLKAAILHRLIASMAIATIAVALGCGPEDGDDEDEPPGVLEYEIPTARLYRLDRRVDIVGVDPMVDRSGCGFLTDRAYDDLVGTLEGLDPHAAYDWSDCEYSPEGLLYLDGFARSPFECNWYCCHTDLLPIAVVYFAAVSKLYGPDPSINGEPYVAFEPDEPCPD
jgi:hypothetical protein